MIGSSTKISDIDNLYTCTSSIIVIFVTLGMIDKFITRNDQDKIAKTSILFDQNPYDFFVYFLTEKNDFPEIWSFQGLKKIGFFSILF